MNTFNIICRALFIYQFSCFIFLCSQQFHNGRYCSVTFLNDVLFNFQALSDLGYWALYPRECLLSPSSHLIFYFVFDFLNFLWRATYILILNLMALFKEIIYLMLKIILFCGSAKNLFYHQFRHNHFCKVATLFQALVRLIERLNIFMALHFFFFFVFLSFLEQHLRHVEVSRPGGPIGAVATGLRHSHGSVGSESHL